MKNLHLFFYLLIPILLHFQCSTPDKPYILISEDAGFLEQMAAREIRRYIYLRSGELLTIANKQPTAGPHIVLKTDQAFASEAFSIQTNDQMQLTIAGGSPRAILYGAYELAEQLGVRFYLHGDVVPDEKIPFNIPSLNISKKPVFERRGIQPFHDFPEGPDWWSEQDYKSVVAQLAKMKMNFVGFHTYPERENFNGTGYKAEPLVWIGKEEDIEDGGRVKAAYPVLHFHTNDSTWGYRATPTSQFALGATQLFETDNYGADYMKEISNWPHTEDENKKIFEEVGVLFREVLEYARQLGFTTCVGTETPLVVPEQMAARYRINKPSDEQIKELYKGIFSRIGQTYPLDYYWLWTPEIWTWSEVSDEVVQKTQKDIQLANEVLDEMGNPFGLATCGWVLGPPKDRAQFDSVLPKSIPFSCINRALGYAPVEPGFQAIEGREKWAIPWMEDDPDMITAQLWVGRLRKDAQDAFRYGCNGLLGIHWRTRIIGPNVSALAKAAWECDGWQAENSRDLSTADFYKDWTKSQFGIESAELVEIFTALDSKGNLLAEGHKGDAPLNATEWVMGPGALCLKGADSSRLARYDFIAQLEAIAPGISGEGNKERYNYWLNSFRFNRATVATALAYRQLDSLINVAAKANGEVQFELVQQQVLPKRTELAKNGQK